jgi:hypothetical protein
MRFCISLICSETVEQCNCRRQDNEATCAGNDKWSHFIAESDKWSHLIAESDKWSHLLAESDKWSHLIADVTL